MNSLTVKTHPEDIQKYSKSQNLAHLLINALI